MQKDDLQIFVILAKACQEEELFACLTEHGAKMTTKFWARHHSGKVLSLINEEEVVILSVIKRDDAIKLIDLLNNNDDFIKNSAACVLDFDNDMFLSQLEIFKKGEKDER